MSRSLTLSSGISLRERNFESLNRDDASNGEGELVENELVV